MVEGGKQMIEHFTIHQGGYCTHPEFIVHPNVSIRSNLSFVFPALFFVLKHKEKGYILVDTGYSPDFFKYTKKWPFWVYGKTTPATLPEGQYVVSQLNNMGIRPDEISYIFISHFHADHIAALKEFSRATFICSRKGYEFVKNKRGIAALKSAFIPDMLPLDFEERTIFIEDTCILKKATSQHVKTLIEEKETVYDIFGDGFLLSVDLSGHAFGQFGLFFYFEENPIFLVSDSCWTSYAVKNLIFPHKLAKLIKPDFSLYIKNFSIVNLIWNKHRDIVLIPSHCQDAKKLPYFKEV